MKDYKNWTPVKIRLNNTSLRPLYREGDIRWVCLGENIGHEQDGKGQLFLRPAVIIRGFNRELFWAVPLTSKIKTGKYYYQFEFRGKTSTAILSQLKIMDAARIKSRRLGRIASDVLREMRHEITKLLK